MTLTKAQLQALRPAIDAALKAVGDEHGVQLTLGNTRFDPVAGTFTSKLNGAVTVDRSGNSVNPAEAEYKRSALMFGIKPESFGKSFTQGGTKFTISGIKPRSRKYPILATNSNGTTYKFEPAVADRAS